MLPGFVGSNGATYEQYLKDAFDCLYREGGKMMTVMLSETRRRIQETDDDQDTLTLSHCWQAGAIRELTKVHEVYC